MAAAEGATETAPGSAAVVLGTAALGFFVVLLAVHPALVNTYGPFGEHATIGLLASMAAAASAGVLLGWLAGVVGRRSPWGLVGYLAALAVVGVVLFPASVDRHESFVERPNERSSCLGLTFTSYPPGTMDASDEVYCVGLERPLPPG